METMSDTIYPGQEFFRIIHEGERAGLYRVEVLATGKEEATLLGAFVLRCRIPPHRRRQKGSPSKCKPS